MDTVRCRSALVQYAHSCIGPLSRAIAPSCRQHLSRPRWETGELSAGRTCREDGHSRPCQGIYRQGRGRLSGGRHDQRNKAGKGEDELAPRRGNCWLFLLADAQAIGEQARLDDASTSKLARCDPIAVGLQCALEGLSGASDMQERS